MAESTNNGPMLKNGTEGYRVPLLINGVPILHGTDAQRHQPFRNGYFQGSGISDCADAVASCSKAFVDWSITSPTYRRSLLLRLVEVWK